MQGNIEKSKLILSPYRRKDLPPFPMLKYSLDVDARPLTPQVKWRLETDMNPLSLFKKTQPPE